MVSVLLLVSLNKAQIICFFSQFILENDLKKSINDQELENSLNESEIKLNKLYLLLN